MKDFFANLFSQVWSAFRWSFASFRLVDVIDILLIAIILYEAFLWIRRTKARALFKGIAVLLAGWLVAKIFSLNMVLWVLEKAFGVGILAVIIIFQPEIRRGLEKLGKAGFLPDILSGKPEHDFSLKETDELIRALRVMEKAKTGALICIEGREDLSEYVQTGISVDAALSAELLVNIFEKNTPLHDGAVIVRGGRVDAATCYLPLSESTSISKELGTRHRAAIGLSEATDAKVFVVSEETGQVSMAYAGHIYRNISDEFIHHELLSDKDEEETTGFSIKKFWHREKEAKK